jgi:hypothetical protein
MKHNYSAWNIREQDFSDFSQSQKLEHLIEYAVLAPSSHNSQPWKFWIKENQVILEPDLSRHLPESDANQRQLYISLGCALANFLIAGDNYGMEFSYTFLSGDDTKIYLEYTKKPAGKKAGHLIQEIPKRLTNRNKYQNSPIDKDLKKSLNKIADKYSVELKLSEDKKLKQPLTNLVMAATDDAMASKPFRVELSKYLHPNITSASTGMPCFGMGIPTPVSFIAPKLIAAFNMSKISGKEERDILENHTPAFGIISTREDTPESWIHAGLAFEEIALQASQNNYATNALAAMIQIGDYYKEAQSLLKTESRPQVFFRLGQAQKAPKHSPRLTAKEVTS